MTSTPEAEYALRRAAMVREQLVGRGIRDERVLAAMGAIPRHLFVPPEVRAEAYADKPLPLERSRGHRETISQPYIVALMSELLGLTGRERVLEIGTGSGYQAAVLARLAAQVYTIERAANLAAAAAARLQELGLSNVIVRTADGSGGLPDAAPFDAILVAAAAPEIPDVLRAQLADGGRLLIPVGPAGEQALYRVTRRGDTFADEKIAPVAFVPLRGQYGWH
jgi:protein-L-isoaspartate(D-aspartate) O-methyltransferase